jgi:hypothetical protein
LATDGLEEASSSVATYFDRPAPPLIALPGISPVNGEKEAGRNLGVLSATLEIGEIFDDGVLLPVHGEKMAAAR